MNMPEWIAIVAVLAAVVCGIRYLILKARKKHRRCKGCPYADMCGRECDRDGK